MTHAQDMLALERELSGAKVSFNIARRALASALSGYIRDAGEDRIIYHAEEYGLEPTLEAMRERHDVLGLREPVDLRDLEPVKKALEAAYNASHSLDDLMAKREGLLCHADPNRMKRFMVGDVEVVFDPEAGVLRDAADGRVIPVEMERIEPNEDYKFDRSM